MTTPKTTARKTKSATVNRMLRRKNGATLAEIESATCWKPHSCRAFLSGVRRKGTAILKQTRSNGQLAYRIAAEARSCKA